MLIYLRLRIFLCLLPIQLPNLPMIPVLKKTLTSVNLKMLGTRRSSPSLSLSVLPIAIFCFAACLGQRFLMQGVKSEQSHVLPGMHLQIYCDALFSCY